MPSLTLERINIYILKDNQILTQVGFCITPDLLSTKACCVNKISYNISHALHSLLYTMIKFAEHEATNFPKLQLMFRPHKQHLRSLYLF